MLEVVQIDCNINSSISASLQLGDKTDGRRAGTLPSCGLGGDGGCG